MDSMHEVPGKGMRATYRAGGDEAGTEILVGNEALLEDCGVALPAHVPALLAEWKQQAKSVALAATRPPNMEEWTLAAALAISDPIRQETVPVIRALRARGISVWMLSGDNASTAQAVAARVGIDGDNVLAGVLPSGKADKIKYLQSTQAASRSSNSSNSNTTSGRRRSARATVAMIGDGINDSPALTAADVGVAIGSGSDVAISSADFVLVKSDLRAVVDLLGLSRAVFRRIKTNFCWAVVYNVVAVPVAAGVLFPITDSGGAHVRLDPVWAALAMALSSVSVVVSSLLLRSKVPWVGFRGESIRMEEAEADEVEE
jgi:cation transport ATPase